MKLYIPTTTLNFNNILSSETISPKAFYGKRGYGYKRWETVAENCLENGILLYKEPFSFNRPSNGLDDYPMLIELEMDESEIAELEPCGDWGYKSSYSLMLTPVTTRFIFFSEGHKRIAMSKSETSAETKLTRLYCGRLSVESYPESSLEYDVADFETPDNEALETDKCQNKIKGFAYGYTIGRMLSRTEPGVKKLNARYDVRDIVASIMSGGEGVVTKEQDETLARDLLLFDNYYVSLLGKIGKETADVAYSLLEKQSSGYNSKRKEYLSYLRKCLSEKEKWDSLQQWITKFINEAEAERADDYNIFDDDGQAEIAVMHGKLTKINDGAKYIDEYKMLVNDVFTSDEYNGKVSTFRMDLANDVTKCVKRKYEDKWEASEIRTYLNAMRHYVAGEQFTQPWTDGVLSSITAVIMKGEDWEGLFRFMVSKGMCDYRYAFGLYGALNGFANLTRDFTDILFAFENKQYVWNIYKEVYRQLTGIELKMETKSMDWATVSSLKESNVGKSVAPDMVEDAIQGVISQLEDNNVKGLKGKKRKIFVCAYREAGGNLKATLEAIKKEEGWKTDCKRLLKDLFGSVNVSLNVSGRRRKQSTEQMLRFDNDTQIRRDFYNDMNAYNHIYEFLNDANELKQVREDLSWFQDNYKNEYFDRRRNELRKGIYVNRPKDNENVIRHFGEYLNGKKNSKEDWLRKKYANVKIDQIIAELRKVYLK